MTRGVLSLADFLGLRLDHAGEIFECDFGGARDGVGGPIDLDVGDAADGAVVTEKGGGGLRQGHLGGAVAKHGHTPVSIELRERQSTD